MPNNFSDPITKKTGDRIDGRNLIQEWEDKMKNENKKFKYLTTRDELNNLNSKDFDHVFGKLKINLKI